MFGSNRDLREHLLKKRTIPDEAPWPKQIVISVGRRSNPKANLIGDSVPTSKLDRFDILSTRALLAHSFSVRHLLAFAEVIETDALNG